MGSLRLACLISGIQILAGLWSCVVQLKQLWCSAEVLKVLGSPFLTEWTPDIHP